MLRIRVADIKIGDLRHRVSFQAPQQVTDKSAANLYGAGDQTTQWREIQSVWANIMPLSGQELFEASKVLALNTHFIIVRYYPKISASWRIYYNDPGVGERYFNIENTSNLEERKIYTVVNAIEVDGG